VAEKEKNVFENLSGIGPDKGCQMVYFQTKSQIWVNFGGSGNGRY
jgi:hypothetical protein